MRFPVCDEIKITEEEKYVYVSILNILSESEKYYEFVGTVTNPKMSVTIKLENWYNGLEIMEQDIMLCV